jgi:hypothetical protein
LSPLGPGIHSRLRRPTLRRAPPRLKPSSDHGPEFLERLVRAAAARCRDVLRRAIDLTYTPPTRCERIDFDHSDRVWRTEEPEGDALCVMSSDAQRSLLEFVLDGPGAAAPTAVERTIIGECVDRLLVAASRSPWREIAVPEECGDGAWRCDAALSREGGRLARFYLYTRAAAVLPPPARPPIGGVPLELTAVLQPLSATLGLMSGLEPGVIIPLSAAGVETHVRLTIHHGPVAFGVLGSAEGKRAVRLNGDAAHRASR